MSQENKPRKEKRSIGLGTIIDIGTTLVGGTALVALSSTALPIAFGVAAVGAGIYETHLAMRKPTSSGVTASVKFSKADKNDRLVDIKLKHDPVTPETMQKVLNNVDKELSVLTKSARRIGAMGIAKLGAAIGLFTSGGATGVLGNIVLGASAVTMGVVGGFMTFGAVALLVGTPALKWAIKEGMRQDAKKSDLSAKPQPPAPDLQPASKLDDAGAKADFKASAEKPLANDNAPTPEKPAAEPKKPAA